MADTPSAILIRGPRVAGLALPFIAQLDRYWFVGCTCIGVDHLPALSF